MKVKKYKAPNMQEAVLKVKSDLGSDAIILDTRKFKEGGFLGFFANQVVEVVATVEAEKKKIKDNQAKTNNNDQAVNSNLEVLQGQMEQLVGEIGQLKDKQNNSVSLVGNERAQKLIESLLSLGFSYDTASQLTQNVFKKNNSYNLDKTEIKESLRMELRELVAEKNSDLVQNNKTEVIALVGPTGVGKTTTLAKLAADYALQQNKKVGLVTADTYRIAAVDQLKTYSEIIDIPLEVAFSPKELETTIKGYQNNYDLVLVDTAGRSQNNELHISELKGFVKKDIIDQVYLVISATTKTEDMKKIIKVYKQLNFDKFIVSKLDETNSLGVVFEALSLAQKPISYVTVGQDVPEDIEEAEVEKLIDNIIEGVKL